MLAEGCMVVFVEIYIYFIVIYLLESYHRLYFSVEESYVYYDFIRLYFIIELYFKRFLYDYIYWNIYTAIEFKFIRKLHLLYNVIFQK